MTWKVYNSGMDLMEKSKQVKLLFKLTYNCYEII